MYFVRYYNLCVCVYKYALQYLVSVIKGNTKAIDQNLKKKEIGLIVLLVSVALGK